MCQGRNTATQLETKKDGQKLAVIKLGPIQSLLQPLERLTPIKNHQNPIQPIEGYLQGHKWQLGFIKPQW